MRASHDRSQNSVHSVGSRRAQLCDMNSLGLCTRGPTAARSGTPSSAATSCSTVPGPSSESGFKNSTYSPRASGRAWLFALGNPTFASLAISRTAGNRARTVSTVPSEEALSTRMISCGIDRALRSMDSRQETSSRRPLKTTVTMVAPACSPLWSPLPAGGGKLSPSVVPPLGPHPFDPLSLRERGNSVRPSFPLSPSVERGTGGEDHERGTGGEDHHGGPGEGGWGEDGTILAALLPTANSRLARGAFGAMGPVTHSRPPGLAGRGVVLGRGPHPQGGAADGAGAHGDHRPLARRAARHAALRVERGAPRECARVVHGVPRVPPSRPAPRAPLRDGALPALQRGVRDRVGRDARALSCRGTEAGPPRQPAPQGRRAPERGRASRR